MNIFKKVVNFLKEVRVELGKVSWSTRKELTGATAVVIVITSIIAVFIWIVDSVLAKALSVLFR